MVVTVQEERRLWKYIILGLLTLGIYDLIFMWKMLKDLNTVCGYVEDSDEDRSPNYIIFCLLCLITLGIYSYVWYYAQGNRMRRAARAYGFEIDEQGKEYVLWMLFGVLLFGIGPFICFYLFIGNVNKLAKAYNYQITHRSTGIGRPLAEVPFPAPEQKPVPSGGQTPMFPYNPVNNFNPTVYGPPNGSVNGGISPPLEVVDSGPTVSVLCGTVECIGGDYIGARITVSPGEELIIGRNAQTSQIVLPDIDISRTHCSIRFSQKENIFYVTDLSTYRTTWLNDTIHLKQGESRPCPLGSKLTLGNGKNQFVLK